jgi:cytochrome c oxidase subunit 2
VPVSRAIDFRVTSLDVNHGFAIYDASDRIVGQVQAMPSVTNHLVMQFTGSGDYTIRCLEYCGPGHSHMTASVHVAPCGPNGC